MDRTLDTRRTTVRVGRNAAARLAAQVVAKLLSLVLMALVTRYGGTEELGRYVMVTAIVGLGVAITDLGLSMLLTRAVAREREISDQRNRLEDLLPLRMGLAVLGAALLILLGSGPFFQVGSRRLLYLGSLTLLPKAAAGILGGFVNGHQRMDVTSSIDVVARTLTLVAAVPVLTAGYGVPGLLACTAAADTVGVLIYGIVLRSWHLLPRFRLAPTAWRSALSDAYPFALTAIIATAYRRLDVMLLSARKGDLAAGQYGAAFSLWEAVGLIPASLLDAMFPEMARMARGTEGREELRRIRRRVGPLLLVGGLLLSVASSLLAGTLLPLVFGRVQGQGSAVAAFRLQVWAVPAMFLYLLNGHTLYALGRQRWVTAAMAVTGLANVGLNLLVIHRWGVLGVSAVALFSAWLLWGLLGWLARRALTEEA